ncbi:MAG: alpha-L-fucosidase [Candidatus Hydrogenedentes bacterium]|nr:alpha-L-fucosidase [Candidatus Hydrogenedentota bacterium]
MKPASFLAMMMLGTFAAWPQNYLGESPESYEQRIASWRDARFGVFISTGPVSLTGQEIGWSRGGERPGQGGTGSIPTDTYDQLYRQYNPSQFDAEEWVAIIKAAGAKYVIFLTKHHDGFNMYDTRLSDYKITSSASPFGRDMAGELARACQTAGIKVIWYYSLGDWYHRDYYSPNHDRFMEYLFGQIRELCTNYGKIDGFWFDLWFPRMTGEDSLKLATLIHELQPGATLNDRFGLPGDYDTPEQRVGIFQNKRPWESCITLGTQWSWKPEDTLKPLKECIRLLVNCAGGDGNLALNTNPMPDGRIEPRQAERFKEIGAWLNRYGESIYGTRGGPYMPGDYGACTYKGDKVYLHVLHWDGEEVSLPPLPQRILASHLLGGGAAEVSQSTEGVTVRVLDSARSEIDTIVVLELEGAAGTIAPITTALGSVAFHKAASASAWKRGQTENIDRNETLYEAAMAFDGDPQTSWVAPDDSHSGWLDVDLGKTQDIDQAVIIELKPGNIQDFELQAKADEGSAWKTLYSGYGLGMQAVLRFGLVNARYIRLNVLTAEGPPAIAEFRLVGPASPGRDSTPSPFLWLKVGASNVRGNLRDNGPDKALLGNGQWAADLLDEPLWFDVDFGEPRTFGKVRVNTSYGQWVHHYELLARENGTWKVLAAGDNLEQHPEISFPPTPVRQIRLVVKGERYKLFNLWSLQLPDLEAHPAN